MDTSNKGSFKKNLIKHTNNRYIQKTQEKLYKRLYE